MFFDNRRVFWRFQQTMLAVYVGVVASELAGWYPARDAILLVGVALCGFASLSYLVQESTRRSRPIGHESPRMIERAASFSPRAHPLITARRLQACLLLGEDPKQGLASGPPREERRG
jgi:hypothetical protein